VDIGFSVAMQGASAIPAIKTGGAAFSDVVFTPTSIKIGSHMCDSIILAVDVKPKAIWSITPRLKTEGLDGTS